MVGLLNKEAVKQLNNFRVVGRVHVVFSVNRNFSVEMNPECSLKDVAGLHLLVDTLKSCQTAAMCVIQSSSV
jgi:hypothetical protein